MTEHEKRKMLDALDAAAANRFVRLFDVLMAESSPPDDAFDRFEAGLGKLLVTWRRAAELVHREIEK